MVSKTRYFIVSASDIGFPLDGFFPMEVVNGDDTLYQNRFVRNTPEGKAIGIEYASEHTVLQIMFR